MVCQGTRDSGELGLGLHASELVDEAELEAPQSRLADGLRKDQGTPSQALQRLQQPVDLMACVSGIGRLRGRDAHDQAAERPRA
ncbi:hypothetical protein AMK33_18360 [Streptomyces sp. CB02400]|nr:hypothetical protein AMK33_18360 [Streptomyces sp. CB02400]